MSKVDTLLKLVAYQQQNPQDSDIEIAHALGISPGYVRRCKKEINLLRHQLTEPDLQPEEVQFLLSLLNQREPGQKEIAQKLKKQVGISYTGLLRTMLPDEHPPVSWLEIGEMILVDRGNLNSPDPGLDFWLQNLCYEPLLVYYRSGEIEGRLATNCEAVNGYSDWQLTLKDNLRWSNGKPITHEEIIEAFSKSSAAPIIEAIKPDGKTQLRVQLSREEPMFPFYLRSVFVLPSRPSSLYRVISGPYRLRRFCRDAMNFRFEPNPDYHRGENPSIDWLTLRRFTHPANAVKAVENGTLDLLSFYLHPLRSFYQFSTTVPYQQWPFFGDNYYILFLNRYRGPLSDKGNCDLLKESIDYRAINRYLRMGQTVEESESAQPSDSSLDIRVACSMRGVLPYLASIIGQSTGSSVLSPVSIKEEMREEVDAYLAQVFFGFGYTHLSQFFHSHGSYNFFGYTNPQVDKILSQLNEVTDTMARRRIGGRVLSMLQDDFAIILLAPCFQYTHSSLEIQFDDKLTDMIDFVQNMSQLTVERERTD